MGRTLFGLLSTIAAGPVHVNRVDGTAGAFTGGSKYRRNIGREGFLQRRQRRDRVAGDLSVAELGPVNKMGLYKCPRDLDRTSNERLDRIRDIVRLVEHIRRVKTGQIAKFGVNQFVKDQEKLERFHRACIQVIVAVFAVVKMKTAEFFELNEPGDDPARY